MANKYTLSQAKKKLAKQGRRGDTELAHVNPTEKYLLKKLGGSGTVNPESGLKEYSWFSAAVKRNTGKSTPNLSSKNSIWDRDYSDAAQKAGSANTSSWNRAKDANIATVKRGMSGSGAPDLAHHWHAARSADQSSLTRAGSANQSNYTRARSADQKSLDKWRSDPKWGMLGSGEAFNEKAKNFFVDSPPAKNFRNLMNNVSLTADAILGPVVDLLSGNNNNSNDDEGDGTTPDTYGFGQDRKKRKKKVTPANLVNQSQQLNKKRVGKRRFKVTRSNNLGTNSSGSSSSVSIPS